MMINLVLFGPPGAGKGTQSDKLVQKYKFVHLSTGDIFRMNIKGETDLGKLAKSYMEKGQLVPDAVTIQMLESEVNKNKNAIGFIFDGFPRNAVQAKALDKFLSSKKTSISKMIALEVSEEELRKRLLERGKTSGRPDDVDPNVIQKRIDVYNSETAPVKDYYLKQNKFNGIVGSGTIDKIFNAICKEIDQLIKNNSKPATNKVSKNTKAIKKSSVKNSKKKKPVAKTGKPNPIKKKTKTVKKKNVAVPKKKKIAKKVKVKIVAKKTTKLKNSKNTKTVTKKSSVTSTKLSTGKKKIKK